MLFLSVYFITILEKNMWGNRYFSWDGSKFTERGNLNKTWDYQGAHTRTIVTACGKVRPCKLSGGAACSAVAEKSCIVRIIVCARQGLGAQYNIALDPHTQA